MHLQHAQQMCWAGSITVKRKALSRHEIGSFFEGCRQRDKTTSTVANGRKKPPIRYTFYFVHGLDDNFSRQIITKLIILCREALSSGNSHLACARRQQKTTHLRASVSLTGMPSLSQRNSMAVEPWAKHETMNSSPSCKIRSRFTLTLCGKKMKQRGSC
jgi:hypothetical protein